MDSGRSCAVAPLRKEEMERQKHGMDVGRVLGDVQKNWDGIGSRFGLCIERGKDVVAGIVKNSAMGNRNVNNSILQFTGLLGQKMEEGRANLLQAWESLNRNHHNTRMPMFASISASSGNTSAPWEPTPLFQLAMSTEQVSKRLDGVPVYTVSNSANEFVLVSDINSQKSLGIFCFRQEDAEALLSQVRDREPSLGRGAKVVAVSLDKVYQLNTEGIAFRFLPDPHQVKNALETKLKPGEKRKTFDGVPVFQSDNLILRSNNRRFCPIFFCKEDLERALSRAFKQQQRVNPSLQVNSNIQVGSFEDVLKRLESNDEDTGWGDIVFIPPGMDAFSHLGKAVAQASKRGESVVA
ncbi:hypothetical protein MPTK1_4g00880 [Marchantia polymorpha subsp. ruderalis]|uniref:Protein TIC 22, chloroplastic n=2 Tax=Marchantia polymorpha TaxID=3197 RepID=A0AAF6B503_MARPO|nr:hypothetical protein MARPO_0066s0055 [Marchantia polymorpha]BBN07087.1 hypothetical protein Mp_4g00880 [Marchantia polymorpha subsp. ruderalis]|eukprot:PTQ36097.1 hypothetical protein MARPO_0066s0055 [Marchantia polymorpha]